MSELTVKNHQQVTVTNAAADVTLLGTQVRRVGLTNLSTVKVWVSIDGTAALATGVGCIVLPGVEFATLSLDLSTANTPVSMIRDSGAVANATVEVVEYEP